jgi:hypothetical protein
MKCAARLRWYRHLTLVLLAYAFLVDITVHSHLTTAAQQESVACPPLIALSTSEARHLLAHLFWPAPTSAPLICQWSIGSRAPISIGPAIIIVAVERSAG